MRVIRSCDMDNGSDNETESVLQLASVGDKDCKHCGVSLHNRMKCNWTPGSEFTLMNKNVICSALILWGKNASLLSRRVFFHHGSVVAYQLWFPWLPF